MDIKLLFAGLFCIITETQVSGLTCYDCGVDTITDITQCQIQRTCADGEKCMLRTLASTADGHMEYIMRCSSVQECDVPVIVGKRDQSMIHDRSVRYDCCSTDLCNVPSTISTVQNVSTTCIRDIQILLEDSLTLTRLDTQDLIAFLKSTVSQMTIGSAANQVGLSTYDTLVHHKWDLDKYNTLSKLLSGLDHLSFSHHDRNNADLHRLVNFLVDSALTRHNGDRPAVPDTVVIFVDQATQVRLKDAIINEKHLLDGVSRDVILVVVGSNTDPSEITQLYQLASSSAHVLHAARYSDLMTIQPQLMHLICK